MNSNAAMPAGYLKHLKKTLIHINKQGLQKMSCLIKNRKKIQVMKILFDLKLLSLKCE